MSETAVVLFYLIQQSFHPMKEKTLGREVPMYFTFIFALILSLPAFAQEANVVDAADGFILWSNGKSITERAKFDTFKEENSQRIYSRKVKDSDGKEKVETYYLHLNKNKQLERVVSYNEGSRDRTQVMTFKNGHLESKTTCYGSDCETMSRGLCKSILSYYGDGEKIKAKLNECQDLYKNIYEKTIQPHLEELTKHEDSNLTWAASALVENNGWNFGKSMSMVVKKSNKQAKKMTKEYSDLNWSHQDFLMRILTSAVDCHDFKEPVKEVSNLPAPEKTKTGKQ